MATNDQGNNQGSKQGGKSGNQQSDTSKRGFASMDPEHCSAGSPPKAAALPMKKERLTNSPRKKHAAPAA
jgi:hypothetical protein